MKKVTLIFIAFALLLCAGTMAQQNSRSGAVRLQKADTTTMGVRAVMLSGRISNDGKTLVSEDQDKWKVSNPDVLAGQLGRIVTVKCRLSDDQTSIHVLSLTSFETNYRAQQDAAMRK